MEIFFGLITLYCIVSFGLGFIFSIIYYKESETPFDTLREIKNSDYAVKDLLITLLILPSVLLSVPFYYIIKIFYNKYTIAFMNYKIKK